MERSLYQEMAAKTARSFNLRCIDGTLHGQSKCVGFCAYEYHRGFLTVQQERAHQCRERSCIHHHPKPPAKRRGKDTERARTEEIMTAAEAATAEQEGLLVLRAAKEGDNSWTVWYTAIAGYDLAKTEEQLCKKLGCAVHMRPLCCDFDTAAALVLKKTAAQN